MCHLYFSIGYLAYGQGHSKHFEVVRSGGVVGSVLMWCCGVKDLGGWGSMPPPFSRPQKACWYAWGMLRLRLIIFGCSTTKIDAHTYHYCMCYPCMYILICIFWQLLENLLESAVAILSMKQKPFRYKYRGEAIYYVPIEGFRIWNRVQCFGHRMLHSFAECNGITEVYNYMIICMQCVVVHIAELHMYSGDGNSCALTVH